AKTAYIERGSPWENGYTTSRVSTRAFATSCSTAKSSTRSERPESSSRVGGATTSAHHNTHLSISLKRTGEAIDTSSIGFRPIQKIAPIHASSGFIRGIPTKAGAGLPGLIVVVRRRLVLVAPSSQRCSQVGLSLAPRLRPLVR